MEIIEIWVPELIIVVFLALPLLRPFFKNLWPLDGLTWLPLIALCIIIGIFPAYGFRPECLPILIFAIVFNTINLFPIISGASSHPNDSFRDRGPALTVFTFILLSAVAIPMFAFSSKVDIKPEETAAAVKTLKLKNRIMGQDGIFDREYLVRMYGTAQADSPLIFIVPPELGSVDSIDLVCTELQKKNFTVVSYSYRDYNLFRKNTSFYPAKLLTYWRVFRKAAVLVSANERGKAWEAERRKEVDFLLSKLPDLLNNTGNNLPPVLLVGYGAGGSALAYLADESSFISSYSAVRGVVAIESRLWSSYLPEPRRFRATPFARGMLRRNWGNFLNRIEHMRPQQVSRSGPLPGAELASGGLPVLYLVSGRALDAPQGQKPYQAVFDTLRSGSGPVALAAIKGAGPLDYQDYPFTHPIYSFLLPGQKDTPQLSENPIDDTAGIIGNFASLLLEQAEFNPPPRHTISGSLYVESRGLPGFRL
jgi:hypothetical protein